jgi:hypothetical protein
MPPSIFVLNGESQPVAVNQAAFDLERDLQTLIADYTDLIPGQLINPSDPRRWLLVQREMGISDDEESGDRWRLDHLFLDQDGTPTLVEVKMERDQRGRREVVAQMLDYAANAVLRWNVDKIRWAFERRCAENDQFPEEMLAEFLGSQESVDSFWATVKKNLESQTIRMIFVSDKIHPELRTIVEFLNRQMDPAEVLAVELQYFANDSRTVRTLVPTIYGQIAVARPGRSSTVETSIGQEDFVRIVAQANSPNRLAFVKSLIAWSESKGFGMTFRTGANRSVFIPNCKVGKQTTYPVSCKDFGKLVFQMRYYQAYEPFQDESTLRELDSMLKKIPGFDPRGGMKGLPYVDMDQLATEKDRNAVLAVIEWILQKVSEPRRQVN